MAGVVDATDDASRNWFASHPTRLIAWSPTGNGYFAHDADLSTPPFDAYRTPANEARRARAIEFGLPAACRRPRSPWPG